MSVSARSSVTTQEKVTSSDRLRSLARFLFPYFLVAPTVILVVMFTLWPAAQTLIGSFYDPPRMATGEPEFVGLQNFVDLFDSTHYIGSNFVQVLVNTLFFTATTVIIALPLALLFALLLNRRIKGLAIWRFSIFYPSLLPLIGAASIWAFIFSDTVGLLNTVLKSFGMGTQNWIGNPSLIMGSVIVVNIWKQAGYYMIFYLAGLQNLSREYYEAAEIEGATYWQTLRYIVLPLLRRTTLFLLIVAATFGFQTVEQLQALGQGKPGVRGNLLLYYIFQNIPERRNLGYVNAMTVILVAILLAFTITNFLAFERKESDT